MVEVKHTEAQAHVAGEVTHEDICNTHEGGPCNCDWSAADQSRVVVIPTPRPPLPPAKKEEGGMTEIAVKPLEWEKGYRDFQVKIESALTGATYQVRHLDGVVWLDVDNHQTIYPTMEAAKAAAQEDYENHIRSAIDLEAHKAEIASRDRQIRVLEEFRRDFKALQRRIIGDTGLSAIEVIDDFLIKFDAKYLAEITMDESELIEAIDTLLVADPASLNGGSDA